MESKAVKLKIKHASDQIKEVEVNTSWKVLQLKQEIAKDGSVEAQNVKLVFKGRVLKDDDLLSQFNVEDGSTMHMVVSKPAGTVPTQPDNSATNQQQAGANNAQQQQGVPNFANLLGGGAAAGFNPAMLGGFGQAGGLDAANMGQYLNDPQVQQMMQEVLQDPATLQTMINSNPMLRAMAQSNPQIQAVLNNPQMLQMMANPQNLQQAITMMQGMQGLGGLGGLGGFPGVGGFPPAGNAQQPAPAPGAGTGATGQQVPQQQQGAGAPPPIPNMANLAQIIEQFQGGLGGQGLNVPGANLQPPEVRYKEQEEQLQAMGFTNKQVNLQVLTQCQGNVEIAIERLLTMMGGN